MKPAGRAPIYAALYPVLAEIARSHGYALAVHGTMQRDLDLIACPWVDEAKDADGLVRAVADAVAAHVGGDPLIGYQMKAATRPHGRVGWSIHFACGEQVGSGDAYIDLSVMPRSPSPAAEET